MVSSILEWIKKVYLERIYRGSKKMKLESCKRVIMLLNGLHLQERQQKRAAELKNAGPPRSAAEATRQMLDRKV